MLSSDETAVGESLRGASMILPHCSIPVLIGSKLDIPNRESQGNLLD